MSISFRPTPPHTLGLVGGVASGKSTVAAIFEAHGCVRIDADQVAREVVASAQILDAIAKRFGAEMLTKEPQALDRAAMAAVVFRDEQALADLEAITHPAIHAQIERALETALAAGDSVVLDIPLLLENGWADRCDTCIFVEASDATRQTRARARGWDDQELARRESNQTDLDVKRSRTSYKVRNNGSLQQTRDDVASVIASLLGQSPPPPALHGPSSPPGV